MIQLDFFASTKEEQLELEVKELRKTCDKVRKGLYARNAELTKMYLELSQEFENLKISMCKIGK